MTKDLILRKGTNFIALHLYQDMAREYLPIRRYSVSKTMATLVHTGHLIQDAAKPHRYTLTQTLPAHRLAQLVTLGDIKVPRKPKLKRFIRTAYRHLMLILFSHNPS